MSIVAIWLLAVGVADLVRWSADRTSRRRSVIGLVAGALVALALALVLGFPAWATVVWTVVVTVGIAGWFWSSDRALARGEGSGWPLGLMLGYLVALLALTGIAPEQTGVAQDWYADLKIPSLAGLAFDRFLLALGALIVLQSTANRVTRLILIGAGTPAAQGESTLRGGRIIGPMERTLIFALGASGQLAAAAAVIAAKGVLRFPEIRSASEDENTDVSSVTEYFLIGTLASWLQAFALSLLL